MSKSSEYASFMEYCAWESEKAYADYTNSVDIQKSMNARQRLVELAGTLYVTLCILGASAASVVLQNPGTRKWE